MKQELIKLLKLAALFLVLSIVIAVAAAMLLRLSFWAEQKAFIYRLIAIAVLCCVVFLLISVFIFRKKGSVWGISFSSSVLCIGLSTVFMCLFFSLGPMTIERSYTVYSLADMTDHPDTVYSAEDIKAQFIEGYIEEANGSQKRIDEQVSIGNLEEVPGGYRITEKGKNLVELFRFLESIFPVPDESSIYPNGQ